MKLDSLNKLVHLETNNFGLDTVLFLIISAGIISGFFYVLRHYVDPLIVSEKMLPKFQVIRFRIEVLSWFIFGLFWIIYLLQVDLIIMLIIIVLASAIGFQFWRDFFPGLFFRLANAYAIGDKVVFSGITGEIEKLGMIAVLLKTKDEAVVFLPYHKLVADVRHKKQSKGKLISHKVILPLGNNQADFFISQCEKWLYQCPWAIAQINTNVSLLDAHHVAIQVYAIDHASLSKIERFLKDKASLLN